MWLRVALTFVVLFAGIFGVAHLVQALPLTSGSGEGLHGSLKLILSGSALILLAASNRRFFKK